MNLKPEELVKALRRCANGESEECPFAERGVCGCPEMSADQIERDQKEIAELRKELEWKDMVIALAQRKQTEAEAERDEAKVRVQQYRALIPSWVIPKEDTP